MHKKRQNTRRDRGQKIDARVLGQILAAQSVISALPDIAHIAEFYVQTVLSIPEITSCRVCLGNRSFQVGEVEIRNCAECEALRSTNENGIDLVPAQSQFSCTLADQPGVRVIAIDSYQHHFGFSIFKIKTAAVFDIYHPFISNLSNYVAVTLENRLQQALLQRARDELEHRVEERTRDLTAANEALAASRTAALNVMQAAIDERQRAEQANADLQREVAERKRAEEALRESREEVKQLFDASPVAMAVSSSIDEHIETVNSKYTELFGYSAEEVSNVAHWWQLAYPDETYREVVKSQWMTIVQQSMMDRKQSNSMDAMVTCKDGSQRYVEFRLSVIGNRQLVTFVDLTERKQMEQELVAREREYRALVENIPDLIVRYDKELRRIYVNPAWEKASGLAARDVINIPYTNIPGVPNPVNSAYLEKIQQALATGTSQAVEFTWVNAYGITLFLEYVIVPEYNPQGKISGVLSVGRDITERKRTEAALRASEARFHEIFENVLDGLYLIDVTSDGHFRIIEANPAIERISGIPRSFSAGKTLDEILPADVAAIANAKHRLCLETDQITEEEIELDLPVGRRLFHATFIPSHDENGKIHRIIGIARDITEEKRAEEERLVHLRFFESMDHINQAIQGTDDLAQMMQDVLDVLLELFNCDRAFLVYPCDPDSVTWKVPMERCRPEYPGALPIGIEMPLTPEGAEVFRTLLTADGPVQFGPGLKHVVDPEIRQHFGIQSYIAMAIYPKVGKAWSFGLHQCSYARVWTSEEERHLQEIGRRISDSLTSLLAYRNLRESEERYRLLVNLSPDAIGIYNEQGIIFANPTAAKMLGAASESDLIGRPILDFIDLPLYSAAQRAQEIQTTNEPTEFVEEKFYRVDGSRFEAEVAGVPFQYQGRQYVQFVARDITERKRHEREHEAIIVVSTALRQATTKNEILNVILDQSLELFEAEGAVLVLPNPQTGGLIDEMGRGEVGYRMAGLNLPARQGISHWVIENRTSYLNNNAHLDPLFYRPDLLGDAHCVACSPLIAKEQAIGALWIARKDHLAEQDLHLLNAITDIAANAIYRVMLHEQTEQQLHHLLALHQIDLAISTNFDLNVTLKVLLNSVKNELKVDAASVLLLDPVTHTLDYASGVGFRTSGIEHSHVRVGDEYAGRAAQEYGIVSCPDLRLAGETFHRASLLAQERFVSHYAAPLMVKGQVKGVLELFHRAALDPEQEWISYFETLSTQAAIAIESATLFKNLQRSNMELTLAYDATIEGWSRALDLRDKETEGHTLRVTEMVLRLAEKMGINDAEKLDLRRGALLHDIGKMGIPDAVLLKAGPLSESEWEIMRQHPSHAYQMLSPISYLKRALEIPYCHHESWDGSGYPRRLKREEIPLSARIFSIVDVFDALTSDRPYRPAWRLEDVYRHIQEQAGRKFDPQVVRVFLSNF